MILIETSPKVAYSGTCWDPAGTVLSALGMIYVAPAIVSAVSKPLKHECEQALWKEETYDFVQNRDSCHLLSRPVE